MSAHVRLSAATLSSDELAQLQLACTSLDTAVQLVLAGREREVCGDRFLFVAPHDSVVFLQRQQQGKKQQQQQGAGRFKPKFGLGGGGNIFPSS